MGEIFRGRFFDYCIRFATEEYFPLIFSSWLKSLKSNVPYSKMRPALYYKSQHEVIDAVLHAPGVEVSLAFSPEDEDQVYGWAVMQGPVLWYVYVKHPWRQNGVSSSLVKDLFPEFKKESMVYVYQTKAMTHLKDKWLAEHNPCLGVKIER